MAILTINFKMVREDKSTWKSNYFMRIAVSKVYLIYIIAVTQLQHESFMWFLLLQLCTLFQKFFSKLCDLHTINDRPKWICRFQLFTEECEHSVWILTVSSLYKWHQRCTAALPTFQKFAKISCILAENWPKIAQTFHKQWVFYQAAPQNFISPWLMAILLSCQNQLLFHHQTKAVMQSLLKLNRRNF